MPIAVYLFLLIQLLVVSYVDIRKKIIANYWAIINLVFFIIALFLFRDTYVIGWKTFLYPFAFLFVGFALYALKIMGAGDSKYLFSFFFLIPNGYQEDFFVILAYSTVIVGFSLLIMNTIKNFDIIISAIRWKNLRYIKEAYGTKFSYAPVIAVAWIWFGIEFGEKVLW
ncbi:hypothetical protein OAT67_00085 [Bacteriovoracaceae bacterium]|nr:hypothetical protein [Bacteriovoracaceae bacterium]